MAAGCVYSNGTTSAAASDRKPSSQQAATSTDWKQRSYPLRLDRSEARKFLNFMEMLPTHKRVLILGSSPELRDGAFITDKRVYCIDDSLSRLESMRQNMKYGRYAVDEQLMECDITKMPEKENFDLILCDETLNRIPLHLWDSVMDQILDRLADSGYVVMKTLCCAPNGYFDEIECAEDIWTKWTESDLSGDAGYLMVHLMAYWSASREDEGESISWRKVMEQMDTTQRAMVGMDIECDSPFWCRTDEELRRMLEQKGFYLEDVHYGDDNADKFKFSPIYVLGKQSYRIGGDARKLVTGDDEMTMQNRLSNWGVW